eukprot:TRINITY_DN9182_c0_g1_i3.p1 TRINITY_DN9182_c0_g1~~TRINITY_DN9182_c0_g1_i3.p1  ORF type:complete len:629 (+),score=156.18 TRINITY_DN9182_c0_g1_i3:412-2298(+)
MDSTNPMPITKHAPPDNETRVSGSMIETWEETPPNTLDKTTTPTDSDMNAPKSEITSHTGLPPHGSILPFWFPLKITAHSTKLNLSTSSLSSSAVAMEALNVQLMLDGNFRQLPLLQKVAAKSDTRPELATAVVSLCEDHGQLEALLNHLLLLQLEKTKHPGTLFREDSFLVAVLNNIMYSDLGVRYLQFLLTPLVTEIMAESAKVLPADAQERNAIFVPFLEKFLQQLGSKPFACPIPLRQVFNAVKTTVFNKFGSDESMDRVPAALDLMFFKFICPAVIDPARFNICFYVPEAAKTCLITVSKILNDMAANQTDKPWGAEINSFIAESHQTLVKQIEILTDERLIDEHKTVLSSSTIQQLNDDQKLRSQRRLMEYYLTNSLPSKILTMDDIRSMELDQVAKLKSDVNRPGWKLFSEKDGISVFTQKLKSKTQEDQLLKVTMNIKVPFDFAMKWLNWVMTNDLYGCCKMYTIEQDDFFSVIRFHLKAPFPLWSREAVRAFWVHKESDDRVVMPIGDVPASALQTNKGYVRLKPGMMGVIMDRDGDDQVKFVIFCRLDDKETARWQRKIIKNAWPILAPIIRSRLEAGYADPSLLPEHAIPLVRTDSQGSINSTASMNAYSRRSDDSL